MPEEAQVVEGRVTRVVYSNTDNGFGVVRLDVEGADESVVVGSFGEVSEEDHLRVSGTWEEHQRFGRRFRAATIQRVTPRTLEGIERYLAGPRIHGVGPALARRIVEHFGSATFEVLEENPLRLSEVEGIGEARAAELARVWQEEAVRRETLVFLQGHGVGPALAAKIVETLGEKTVELVRGDPYVLVDRVSGVGFRTADGIARKMGYAVDGPPRLRAALIHVLDEAVTRGNLCLPGGELLRRAAGLIELDERLLRPPLSDMAKADEIVVARPDGTGLEHRVYRSFAWEAEREASGRLLALATEGEPARRLSSVAAPEDVSNLTAEQRDAVLDILDAKVSVLTGGPGVGKTTVLRTLVSVWRRAGLRVSLCCPTGRAARRMEEASGLDASTIHRMLKFDGRRRRFAHGEDFPVKADQVVVDEASMLDLPLMVSLLRALGPDTRLLLIGDADQLPSVGPGTVLRDVVRSGAVTVRRLTRIFRQAAGSAIVELAHAILDGELIFSEDVACDVEFIRTDDPMAGAAEVSRQVLEVIPESGLADVDGIQVLCPMHKGPTGTRELNRMIQDARGFDRRIESGEDVLCVGDRVMQIRNDYDRELFNGDQGIVLDVDVERRTLVADFDGIRHELSAEALRDVRPAWAISIHKSQGGEYPVVVLPLFAQHYLMLQRQVLYTAVTRAKRKLVIIGEDRALHQAVSRNDMSVRYSHLADWMQGLAADTWRPAVAED